MSVGSPKQDTSYLSRQDARDLVDATKELVKVTADMAVASHKAADAAKRTAVYTLWVAGATFLTAVLNVLLAVCGK